MKKLALEIIGWAGTVLIVAAFFLMSHNYIDNGGQYQVMNVAGSVCLATQLWTKKAWPAFGLQLTWIAIALSALWSI